MSSVLLVVSLLGQVQAGEFTMVVTATDDGFNDRQGYVPPGCPLLDETVTYTFVWYPERLRSHSNILRGEDGRVIWTSHFRGTVIDYATGNIEFAGELLIFPDAGNFTEFTGPPVGGSERCRAWFAGGASGWVDDFDPGDANLDGVFNSSDLIQVFQAGEYEDTHIGSTGWVNRYNSTWAEGDFDGNAEFDSADLVVALQTGGYTQAATRAVPEPTSLGLVALGLSVFFIHRRRQACLRGS